MAGSTSNETDRSAVTVCMLVQRLDQSEAFICLDVEALLDNYDLRVGIVLDDTLIEYESVTGHPVADTQIL